MKTIRIALFAWALCGAALSPARAELNWLTDFSKAQAEAKASHRLLLLNFTGSDWCMWCIKLQREVFSQPEFEAYAQKNLVLMMVDFPRAKPLSHELRTQNYALAQRYQVEGFPTILVLNSEGRPVGMLGYEPGGPVAFLNELKKVPGG